LNTVYERVNCKIGTILEYWDFCAKNVDEAWDFLDWLAQDTYEYEISYTNSCIPPPCIPNYAPPVCEIYRCSNHASNSCPYSISDGGFARLSNMIETIKEQQITFANKIQEYNLSPDTDLSSSSSRLDVNLCDDDASSHTLVSGLEEVLDHPLTTLPPVTPFLPNTLRDNTSLHTTYPNPPFPLAQSIEFKGGETFCVDASVNEDDMCCELDNAFIEVHDLDETFIARSCVDVVVAVSSSPDLIDLVLREFCTILIGFDPLRLGYWLVL